MVQQPQRWFHRVQTYTTEVTMNNFFGMKIRKAHDNLEYLHEKIKYVIKVDGE